MKTETTKPYRIDVHHHILPSEYVKALSDIGITEAGGVPFPQWSPDSAIAFMDRHGIATAITSISSPGVYFGERTFARDLARRCNEISAQLVSDYPTRFGAFAVLPLPDVEMALQELAYALDTLKLDGVILLTSIGQQYLGDSAFEPMFAELNRRKTTVFIHPTLPPGGNLLKIPACILEFVFDTTRAIANLIYSGTLERYPDISFILSHAGGTAPCLTQRLSLPKGAIPELDRKAPQGVIAYLKRLYYDTALSANSFALRPLQELVDSSQILFGSDYPFAQEPTIATNVQGLTAYDGFDNRTRTAIERDNALSLFPRLQCALTTVSR